MAEDATYIMMQKLGEAYHKVKRESEEGTRAQLLARTAQKKRPDSQPPVQEGEKQRKVLIEKGIAGDAVHESASEDEILKVIRGVVRAIWMKSDNIYYTEEGLKKMMDKYKGK